MTNLQEAKLAREAEICYTTIALVTDYDCWHPDHDQVTVEMIVANLTQNAKTAQQVIAAAVERLPIERDLRLRHARWRPAIITRRRRDARPTQARARADNRQVRSIAAELCRRLQPTLPSSEHQPSADSKPYDIIVTGSIAFDYLMSFPGTVHRALPARASGACQPQLSRRHDGQAARRVRAEHRLHAGAARRAAAPDGARPARTSATIASWLEAPASTPRSSSESSTASSPRRSSAAPTSDNNQIASFYTGAMAQRRRAVVPQAVEDCEPGRSSRRTIPRRWSSTRRSAGRWDSLHLGSGSAVRAHGRRRAARRGSCGAFMVICNDYEFELIRQKTGLGETDDARAGARVWS